MDTHALTAVGVRAFAYLCIGITAEILFTGVKNLIYKKDVTMTAFTTVWMFPIYALGLTFAFEPLDDLIDPWPLLLRASIYAVLILVVEYLAATLYIFLLKKNPWKYEKGWHVHGKIRLDYFPFWAAFGIGIEHVHDFLRAHIVL